MKVDAATEVSPIDVLQSFESHQLFALINVDSSGLRVGQVSDAAPDSR